MLKHGSQKLIMLMLGIAIFIGFWATVLLVDKHQHEIVLAFKCFNKSFEERHGVYSTALDETPGNFYRRKLALSKIIDMRDNAVPLILSDLSMREHRDETQVLLINAIGNISPDVYCNIIAGSPYSELEIDPHIAKRALAVSLLKNAPASPDRSKQILELLQSFGDEYGSSYQDYKGFCASQKDVIVN